MVLFLVIGCAVVRYGVMTVNDCAVVRNGVILCDWLMVLFFVTGYRVVRYGVIPSDWLCSSALWCYSL